MTTHRSSVGSTGSPPPRSLALQDQLSWTDDLPVCHLSGVGFATNQIYREDGFRQEEHPFEDRSIHFRLENDVFLYGVFDGHDGSRVSHFAAQRMPAELLLGQLQGKTADDDIKDILIQAFISVEKGYFDSIDDALAAKANLQLEIPAGMNSYELCEQYPDLMKKLHQLEQEIGGGTTAAVAVIVNNKLYVANVGCSRALFCQIDHSGVLKVHQLSVDHNLNHQPDAERLASIGVDVEAARAAGDELLAYTRTIGDYNLKAGCRDIEFFMNATADPVLSDPDVTDGLELENVCGFLILMSYGAYKCLEDALQTQSVNAEIAKMVASEFTTQSTLNGVVQAVVDKIVRIHHDVYMTSSGPLKEACQKRKDITLLVRNFNFPLPQSISSPTSTPKVNPLSLSYLQKSPSAGALQPLSVMIPTENKSPVDNRPFFPLTNTNQTNSSSGTNTNTFGSTNDSTQSGNGSNLFDSRTSTRSGLTLDSDGFITAYVDFSGFHKFMSEMTEAEREAFDIEAELKPGYETIPEETSLPIMDGVMPNEEVSETPSLATEPAPQESPVAEE